MAVVDTDPGNEEAARPIVVWTTTRTTSTRLGRVLQCPMHGAARVQWPRKHSTMIDASIPIVACGARRPPHARAAPGRRAPPRVAQIRPHCRRAVVTGFPESEHLITAINAGPPPLRHHRSRGTCQDLPAGRRLSSSYVQARARQPSPARRAAPRQHPTPRARAQSSSPARRARPRDLSRHRAARAMGTSIDAAHPARAALTGLYTHRAFQERLREEVARALR